MKTLKAVIGAVVLAAAGTALYWFLLRPTPLERARTASDRGDPGAAVEILLKRLETPGLLPPEERPLRQELARAYLVKGAYDSAEGVFHSLDEKFPDDPYAALGLGYMFLSRGQDAFAADYLAKAKKLAPQDTRAAQALVALFIFRGEYDKARAEALDILNLSPTDATARRRLGEAEFGRGLFTDAAQAFEAVLQASPADKGTRQFLAWSLLGRAGELRRLEETLALLLKESPDDQAALSLQAHFFRARSYHDEADALLRRLYEKDPRRLFSGVALARAAARRRETEAAQTLLMDIAQRLPKEEDIPPAPYSSFYEPWDTMELRRNLRDLRLSFHLAMADVYRNRYLLSDAEREVRLALQLAPRSVEALRALTELKRVGGDARERLKAARSAADFFPQHPEILLDQAQALLGAKRPQEALTFAQGAAGACPSLARAQAVLAEVRLALGQNQAAEETAAKALSLNDRDPSAWLASGLVKAHRNDWREAEKDFAQTLALDGFIARAHWERAKSLEKLQKKREARTHRERALDLEPRVYAGR